MAIQDIIEIIQRFEYIFAIIIIIASYIVGQIAKLILRKVAKRLTKKTKTSLDDEILQAIDKPILWAITIAGINIALLSLTILNNYNTQIITAARITGIIIGCWTTLRIVKGVLQWYQDEISIKTKTDMDDKYLHIFRRVINFVVYAIVGILILGQLGVEITPFVMSLGIGGLAIALALKDTLANLFSGFYMISDRAVKIGDYVEIEAAGGTVKGHVKDISWRTSKLKTLTDNYVIVPNSIFANSTVINYQAPTSEMSVIIPVGVSYDADLEKVEKITNEVIVDCLEHVEGGKKGHKPAIRFKEFADSSINFIAIIRVKDPTNQSPVRHEFIKRLKKRYDQEGIQIPFPIRTVYMNKQE
jgi:small-conductance mechanosensitive channel